MSGFRIVPRQGSFPNATENTVAGEIFFDPSIHCLWFGRGDSLGGDRTHGWYYPQIDSSNNLVLISGTGIGVESTSPRTNVVVDLGASTTSFIPPTGTTAQRPGTGINGMIRYNSDLKSFEGYINGSWGYLDRRISLTANTTFYVATTGSDITGDGSSGSPWLTLQHASDYVQKYIDLSGYTVTISVASGTYTSGVLVTSPYVGETSSTGSVIFQGDTTNPANCFISTTSGWAFRATNNAIFSIKGFKTSCTSNHSIAADMGGIIYITGNMEFGTVGAGLTHIVAQNAGSSIFIQTGYTVSGSGACHYQATLGGTINVSKLYTTTLTGTPAFSQSFAQVWCCGQIFARQTYTGSATGLRYYAISNGVIDTGGGASYFPGSVSGSTASGGQYV